MKKTRAIPRILFLEFTKDLIHLGEKWMNCAPAIVDLFNPRTLSGRLRQIHVTYPTCNCTNGDTHHRRIPLCTIDLGELYWKSLRSTFRSVKRARKPSSIDPLDRAGAARLAGMDRDRDRGTTTRGGATRGSPRKHHRGTINDGID